MSSTRAPVHKFLWWRIRPLTARRLAVFRANRRGYWSMWVFLVLFFVSLFAELIANDRPLLVYYKGSYYTPVFKDYPETTFGGFLPSTAVYDSNMQAAIRENGWMIWPLIPYRYDTTYFKLKTPPPTAPDWEHLLGTDNAPRDVLANVIYGFRISVLFGLALTLFSSVVGVAAGAVQGYFGGRIDLYFQRFIEIWDSVPVLYLLIILSAFIQPDFWWLLGIMLLFSWMGLVGVVRAEFLRARNFDYVRAARAMGASSFTIMYRHVLPNAMVATVTFMPFILSGSIVSLTALDYLGFGLPPGSPSLGLLVKQGKELATSAPWLGITAFVVLAVMLSLLVFIGEAVRDAFDPRKSAVASGPAPEPQAVGESQALSPAGGNAVAAVPAKSDP
ncbi:MAG: ABC transporter permease [Rhodospirillaceae bacterium]|nr:ABC transporter permease [Rhodospirillaceae bacterium]